MHEIHDLEKRLRSWAPRPPSPKLKQALFAPTEVQRARPEYRAGMRWLVPASAAMLAMLILFNNRPGPEMEHVQTNGSLAAVIMSNRNAVATYAATAMQTHNNITADFVEWTNGNGSVPRVFSVSVRKGN